MSRRPVPSKARARSIKPQPCLCEGKSPSAKSPVRYEAELIRKAFVIAGEGGRLSPRRFLEVKNFRTRPAAPVTCGAARLVPEDQVNRLSSPGGWKTGTPGQRPCPKKNCEREAAP